MSVNASATSSTSPKGGQQCQSTGYMELSSPTALQHNDIVFLRPETAYTVLEDQGFVKH